MKSHKLTTKWLRDTGFKWHQLERQPSRHWLLWIGDCLPEHEPPGRTMNSECFGVEVAKGDASASWWVVWFRADYAGRYSRFLCAGHISTVEQLSGMIAGIIGRPFDPRDSMYGTLFRPDYAARQRDERSRFDLTLARHKDGAIAHDEARQIERKFAGQDWFRRVEVEDERSVVVWANRWPTYEERQDLPPTAAIECWDDSDAGGAP